MPFEYLKPLLRAADTKIVLLVLDGLGGLPIETGGLTELEAANTPNMDRLTKEGALGQTIPIQAGITPGSGPAHLALFGYDPLVHMVGRGVLEATGVGMRVEPGDVAARGNFCTLDADGNISDRRAGRIPSEEARPLVELLNKITFRSVETDVRHLREYRFALVFRGPNLGHNIADTDPQVTGKSPLMAHPLDKDSRRTAKLVDEWIEEARQVLMDHPTANGLTLRGFGTDPVLPKYQDAYGLKAACTAVYPMYRGAAKLVGMDVIEFDGELPENEFNSAINVWENYDFHFIHIKKTDSKGEDGDFQGKVSIIESVDKALPILLEKSPDVLIITGDHSTPAKMRSHSWHPVPVLLWAPNLGLPDSHTEFGERNCSQGGLGTFPAIELMSLALAHAGRLKKFGA